MMDLVMVFAHNGKMGSFGLEALLVSNIVDSVYLSVFLVFVGEGSVHNQGIMFIVEVFQFAEGIMFSTITGLHAEFEALGQNFGILTDGIYLVGISEGNSEQSDENDNEFHFECLDIDLL